MNSEYHIYCDRLGWLDDSERAWSRRYSDAASFTSFEDADQIGDRECPKGVFYVMKSCCQTDN